jgi:hypothetical protein
VGPTGAPDVARQLMRLRLSAVWVLMVAFEGPVQVPGGMEGAQQQVFCRYAVLQYVAECGVGADGGIRDACYIARGHGRCATARFLLVYHCFLTG